MSPRVRDRRSPSERILTPSGLDPDDWQGMETLMHHVLRLFAAGRLRIAPATPDARVSWSASTRADRVREIRRA